MPVRRVNHFARIAIFSAVVAAAAVPPGWVTTSLAAPKKAVTAKPVLGAEQLQKILKRLEESGRTRPLPTKVTAQLWVTKGDATLTVREIAFEHAGYQHGFYKSLETGKDYLLLAFRTPEKKWTAFLTNSQLKLISAVSWDAGEMPATWSGREADQAFDNELVYWSTLAEIF